MPHMQEPQIDCNQSDFQLDQDSVEPNTYTVSFRINAYGINTDGTVQVIFKRNDSEINIFNLSGYDICTTDLNINNIQKFDNLGRTQIGNTTFSNDIITRVKSKIREVAQQVASTLDTPLDTPPQTP